MEHTTNTRLEIEGGVALLTIDRPKALNALNTETLRELHNHLDHLALQGEVKVVVLTGAGAKSFVAGADIREMKDMNPQQALAFSETGQALMLKLRALPQPTIAAVNGFALGGGCELAMACDLLFAASNAKFGQPEINLGVLPGFGGTQRMSRHLGAQATKYLCLTGDTISAEEAHRLGLVLAVFPAETFLTEVKAIAAKIAAKPPLAATAIKRVVDQGAEVDLDRSLTLETQAFALSFSTADQKEGMAAFVEKRPAIFKGC